jgi:leucyl-tRNA synthetase
MVCHETYKNKKGKWLYPEEVEKNIDGHIIEKKNKTKVIVGPKESMSKSKKNTVDPEEMINAYGADSIRWFILSDSPPSRDIQWSKDGVSAAFKFIQKLWSLNNEILNKKQKPPTSVENIILQKAVNKTIYNVTKNLENFQYNVVIANIHEIYNVFFQSISNNKTSNEILKNSWEKIIMLLNPIIPHFSHECCEKIKKEFYWPGYDESFFKEENCNIVIQVNGKKRGIFKMPLNSKESTIIKEAKKIENVSKYIAKTTILKNIYLKNKLINFIIKK